MSKRVTVINVDVLVFRMFTVVNRAFSLWSVTILTVYITADVWMTCDNVLFNVFFFFFSVISGRWAGNNESLCATKPRL